MLTNLKYFSLSLFLLTLLLLSTDLVLPGHIFWADKNIHQHYLAAAENPFNYTTPPFCWRIIVPLIVYILPFSKTVSFISVSIISLVLSGFTIAKILEHYKLSTNWVYVGIALFYSTVFAVRYNIIEFYNPDALLIFLMLLGIYFIQRDKKYLFITTAIIGVLVKESYLIILPLYYTLNFFKKKSGKDYLNKKLNFKNYFNKNLLLNTLQVSILPAAAFILIRLLIRPEADYSYFAMLEEITHIRWEYLLGSKLSLNYELFPNQPDFLNSLINIYRVTLGAFGGLFILGLIKIKKHKNIFLQYSPLIAGAYIQILFAVDNERLVVLAFLPLLIASLFYLKEITGGNGRSIKLIYGFTALYFSLQLILTHNVYYELYYSVVDQILLTFGFLSVVLVIQSLRK